MRKIIIVLLITIIVSTAVYADDYQMKAGNYSDKLQKTSVDNVLADNEIITIEDEAFKLYIIEALENVYYYEAGFDKLGYYEYADKLGAYKQKLKTKGITFGEMKKLKQLKTINTQYSDGKGGYYSISSIKGIEYAVNLESLTIDIPKDNPSFLMPIAGLSRLTYLELPKGNPSVDLSCFSGLKSLKELKLGFLGKGELSPLSNLVNLEKLEFGDYILYGQQQHIVIDKAKILDITPLKHMTHLKEFNTVNNPITDLSPLKDLHELTTLRITSSKLKDISPLKGLKQLESLYLEADISNITDLGSLVNLRELTIHNSRVLSDISAISNMLLLKELDLSVNNISDISPLASLTQLTELNLTENKISDIRALSSLANLEVLYLGDNQISDISALGKLVNLTDLTLSNNKIKDISAIKTMKALRAVSANTNQIEDAGPFKELNNLSRLGLVGNPLNKTSRTDLKLFKQKLVNFAINKDIVIYQDVLSSDVPVKTLTEDIIARLQSYAYYQKEATYTFEQMAAEKADSAKWVYDNFFEKVIVLNANEKFFTSERLTYKTWADHFVIRGILQVKKQDGTVEEQEKEYEFLYGGWDGPKILFVEARILSDKKVMK